MVDVSSKSNEEMIVNFGALGYNASKMAIIIGAEEIEIETLMKDSSSAFSKLYKKGVGVAEYVIDLKLFELAKTGDIKALEKLDQRKRQRR